MNHQSQPDYEIRKKIVDANAAWSGVEMQDTSEYYFSMDYPQRIDTLRFLLKNWILRATGEIDKYIAWSEELNNLRPGTETDDVVAIRWLQKEIKNLKPVTPEPNLLVIGLMAWGNYVDSMTDMLFKSWLTPGNIPALKSPVIVHIITDNEEKVEAAESTKALKKHGVHFVYTMLPPELIAWQDKYWLIGIGASLHLSFARAHYAAFHHSFPDTVYSENFFSNLERLTQNHKNILMTTHRTDAGLMEASLKNHTVNDVIAVPAAALGAYSLNNIHCTAIFCKVNGAPHPHLIPMKYFLLWESETKLYTASPHINPIYLHASLVAKLQDRYYVSLDSEMDYIITDNDFYIPQAEDDMCWVEMTGRHGGGNGDDQYIPFQEFHNIMWRTIMFHDTLKFFAKVGSIPVDRAKRKPAQLFPDGFIKAQHEMLVQSTIAADPFRQLNLKTKRQHEK